MKLHPFLFAGSLLLSVSVVHGATVAEVLETVTGDYVLGNSSLHAAPVALATTDDAVYLELIVAGHEQDVRQMVLTFWEAGDDVMARVYVFPEEIGDVMAPDLSTLAVGLWAAPEHFPKLLPSQLDPVADVKVDVGDDGVRVVLDDAPVVQMNALLLDMELAFDGDGASWARTGLDMGGETVWNEEVVFTRSAIEPPVTRHENGLVTIDIREGSGVALEEGDHVAFHYVGVLSDGRRFDATTFPGRGAYTDAYPGTLYKPLADGLAGIECPEKLDETNQFEQPIRKVIVPPELGFGDQGRGPVPGGATMYYLLLVQSILDKTPEAGSGE